MRYLLMFFAVYSYTGTSLAQTGDMDTLKKCSYYVYGKQPSADGKSVLTVEGTCFFILANAKIMLVSAKHLMTGWSTSDAAMISPYPDTLFVRLPGIAGSQALDYPLDIRKLKGNISGDFYYNKPDIFVMEFPDADSIPINTLVDFQLHEAFADTGNASIVHGFPNNNCSSLEGNVYSSPGQNLHYRDHKRNTDVTDKINYLIKCNGEVRGGYSGAPVFLKSKSAGNWYFAGVISQGVQDGNYFFVVKPAYLIDGVLPGK